MTIKFLKAGSGDAVLIQHNNYNILVDGGNESKHLIDQMIEIHKKDQALDLVIITHHDDDHIAGILELLQLIDEKEFKRGFIKRILFNSPRTVAKVQSMIKDKFLSYRQARDAENSIALLELTHEICTEDSEDILYDDLRLKFLSPTKEDVEKYAHGKGTYLASDYRCDWNTSLRILEGDLDDSAQDDTIINKSSIVVLVECEGKKVLLTGDTTPARLNVILTKLQGEAVDTPVVFDLVKLPHHGSYRSLNKILIEKINCKNFVISTNSKKYNLPNKRAILKILKHLKRKPNEQINFKSNYPEPNKFLKIEAAEFESYHFNLKPNNEIYGFLA